MSVASHYISGKRDTYRFGRYACWLWFKMSWYWSQWGTMMTGCMRILTSFVKVECPKISVEKLFHLILSRLCKLSVNSSEQAIEYFSSHDYSVIFRLEGLVIRNNKETVRLNSHTFQVSLDIWNLSFFFLDGLVPCIRCEWQRLKSGHFCWVTNLTD